jgi:uncharacterized protein (DUF2126 family)
MRNDVVVSAKQDNRAPERHRVPSQDSKQESQPPDTPTERERIARRFEKLE